ncbi:hypothetical protein BV20DRAFT_938755 [Pilatotrama ljubarskyi]|nr:hypothetical protein BV20DRAFT_938755 [Pilatotrama ljubarskyi]
MAEMLTMLQEFQKRKATKTSARSITFQNAKSALFSDARKKVDKAVRDGTTALENAHAAIINVKAKEISQESALASLKSLWDSQDECVQDLVGNLSGVIEDLAHRRAAQINETSAMRTSISSSKSNSDAYVCVLLTVTHGI